MEPTAARAIVSGAERAPRAVTLRRLLNLVVTMPEGLPHADKIVASNGRRSGAAPARQVLDVAVVAGPYYGCAFSDPAAYAAGTGSRRLFSACPAP